MYNNLNICWPVGLSCLFSLNLPSVQNVPLTVTVVLFFFGLLQLNEQRNSRTVDPHSIASNQQHFPKVWKPFVLYCFSPLPTGASRGVWRRGRKHYQRASSPDVSLFGVTSSHRDRLWDSRYCQVRLTGMWDTTSTLIKVLLAHSNYTWKIHLLSWFTYMHFHYIFITC